MEGRHAGGADRAGGRGEAELICRPESQQAGAATELPIIWPAGFLARYGFFGAVGATGASGAGRLSLVRSRAA